MTIDGLHASVAMRRSGNYTGVVTYLHGGKPVWSETTAQVRASATMARIDAEREIEFAYVGGE
jgi:hypothetical protein